MMSRGMKNALLVASGLLALPLSAAVIELSSEQELDTIVNDTKPCVVKFAATWCGACKMVATPFKEVSDEAEFSDICFVNADIDTFQKLAKNAPYNVAGVPTIFYMHNGEIKNQTVGIENPDSINESLRTNIRDAFKLNTSGVATNVDAQGAKVNESPAQDAGVLAKVWAFFVAIVVAIKDFFIGVFRWVASLFGK